MLKEENTFFPFLREGLNVHLDKSEANTVPDKSSDLMRVIINNFSVKYDTSKKKKAIIRRCSPRDKPPAVIHAQIVDDTTVQLEGEAEVCLSAGDDDNDSDTVTDVESIREKAIHNPDAPAAHKGFHHEQKLWSRMLVEDCMFLEPGAEVLILVRISIDNDTPHCRNYNRLARLCDLQPHDYPFVHFRKYDYFQIHGVVKNNIYRKKLLHGYWDQKDVYDHVHGNHRGCFSTSFLGKDGNVDLNLYWCDVLSKNIVVFSLPPFKKQRDFYWQFETKKRNLATRRQYLDCLFDEVVLDLRLATNLYLAFVRVQKMNDNLDTAGLKELVQMYCNIEMGGKVFTDCLRSINEYFKNGIERCYREPVAIVRPVVEQDDLQACIDILKSKCGNLFYTVWEMLGFHRYSSKNKKHAHKARTYERKVLYHILSTSRVRNSHLCVHWALVRTAALYAVGASRNLFAHSGYFGAGTSADTFLRYAKPLAEKLEENIMTYANRLLSKW